MIYQEFIDFIGHRQLLNPHDRVLLGVSGGIDSMVLMDLFVRSGWQVGIAHCNYQLREDESEGDHLFVRDQARR